MVLLKALIVVVVAVAYYYIYTLRFGPEQWDPVSLTKIVEGKRVLITGASSGIAEQLAYQYAALGASVFITARRENILKKVIARCQEVGKDGSKHGYVKADMMKPEEVHGVIPSAVEHIGGLDVLILSHAAFVDTHILLWNGSQEHISKLRDSLEVHFMSYVLLASDALPYLEKNNGSIGLLSSAWGRLPATFAMAYASAKHATEGFFQGLRGELAFRGVNVSITIFPLGGIETENANAYWRVFMSDMTTYQPEQGEEFSNPKRATAEDCAKEIARATSRREKESWYPPEQGYWWLTLKTHFFP